MKKRNEVSKLRQNRTQRIQLTKTSDSENVHRGSPNCALAWTVPDNQGQRGAGRKLPGTVRAKANVRVFGGCKLADLQAV